MTRVVRRNFAESQHRNEDAAITVKKTADDSRHPPSMLIDQAAASLPLLARPDLAVHDQTAKLEAPLGRLGFGCVEIWRPALPQSAEPADRLHVHLQRPAFRLAL